MVKFIADIASNFDGELERAKLLIRLAKEAGADAVKFQHFKAESIVSEYGFDAVGKLGHQAKWKQSVTQVYKNAEINREWTSELLNEALKYNIAFMTSPYDYKAVDLFKDYVYAFKVGSGDLNYTDLVSYIAKTGRKIFMATGASYQKEVDNAISNVLYHNKNLVVMQCNTNYQARDCYNVNYVNLNYIDYLREDGKLRGYEIGLSDHTKVNTVILGAVAKGAQYIERHFTDDSTRGYPDHVFSMDPIEWSKMIYEVRELENMLGDGVKKVEENEEVTRIIQRRAWYVNKDIKAGQYITGDDIMALRPCSSDMIPVDYNIIGIKAKSDIKAGEYIKKENFYE